MLQKSAIAFYDGKTLDRPLLDSMTLASSQKPFRLVVGDREVQESDLAALLQKHQLLAELVKRIRFEQVLQGIDVQPDALEQECQAWCVQNRITPQQLPQLLAHQKISLEQWKASVENRLRLRLFQDREFGHRVENHFLKRKSQLDLVSYSLLRHSDGNLIQELYQQILHGEASFEELATQFSQGHEAKTGGKLGPVPLSQPHPALAEILRTAQLGQVLPPCTLESYWLIIRLDQLQPVAFNETIRQQMLQELFDEWLGAEVQHALNAL